MGLAHAVVKREADPQVLAALPYAAAPVVAPATFASVGAVAHAPVVKAVVESPAEVSHEVAPTTFLLPSDTPATTATPSTDKLFIFVSDGVGQTCHRFILPRNPDLV